MQILEFRCPHGVLSGQTDLPHAESQNLATPLPHVTQRRQSAAHHGSPDFVEHNGRNDQFICGEGCVATLPCPPSELWNLLGHPKDGVRIEQEGHRIAR